MQKYVVFAVILNFLVDWLLLLGASKLAGYPQLPGRSALASSVGTMMTAASFLPGFAFLRGFLWRSVSLALMGSVAYGWSIPALRRGLIFVLLSMALNGIAQGFGGRSILSVLAAGVLLLILCGVGFRGGISGKRFVPVELTYGNSNIKLTALQDTGNMLRDPVTGQPVLVVGADVAGSLIGLTPEQLRTPVDSLECLPGLRLVPFHTVGQSDGLMLALKLSKVRIGAYQGSSLVAFAPRSLDAEGGYQALTGGFV